MESHEKKLQQLFNFSPIYSGKKVTRTRSSYGYTLIELIVVIAVMAILFTVGSANYRDYSRKREVTNAVLLFKGDLRLAQEYAISGRKPDTSPDNLCEDDSTLEYYSIERDPTSPGNGEGYSINAFCTKGANKELVLIKYVNLKDKGIVISPFSNTVSGGPNRNRLYFKPRGLGVANLTDKYSEITLSLESDPAVETKITVTAAGEIK